MGVMQALSLRENFVTAKHLAANGAITGIFRNVPTRPGKRIGDIGPQSLVNVWNSIKAVVLYAPVVSTVRLFHSDGFQTVAAEQYSGDLSLGFVSEGSRYDPPNENSDCHRYNNDTSFSMFTSYRAINAHDRYVVALRDMWFHGLPIIWQNILKTLHLK